MHAVGSHHAGVFVDGGHCAALLDSESAAERAGECTAVCTCCVAVDCSHADRSFYYVDRGAVLGFDRFGIAGHDRGARVAYRLALDHPGAVSRIAALDIIPTAEMWSTATAASAMSAYHWYMLAQPRPLPERLIGGDPHFFVKWTLSSWAGKGFDFDAEALADYITCFSDPACIHATCEDYRAGWTVDRVLDEADRGRRRIESPLLLIWGEDYGISRANPLETQ